MLKQHRGVTLIEMIIGLSLGVLVLSIALNAYIQITHSSRLQLTQTRLHHDLTTALGLMTREFRRAGYWHDAARQANGQANNNPFTSHGNDIHIDHYDNNEAVASCLTYSYDLDDDGQVSQSQNEQFGFRLRDRALELRIGGHPFNCQQGRWQKITPASTLITALRFQLDRTDFNPLTGQTCTGGQPCQQARAVHITVSGHLSGQATAVITLNTLVAVRNHKRL